MRSCAHLLLFFYYNRWIRNIKLITSTRLSKIEYDKAPVRTHWGFCRPAWTTHCFLPVSNYSKCGSSLQDTFYFLQFLQFLLIFFISINTLQYALVHHLRMEQIQHRNTFLTQQPRSAQILLPSYSPQRNEPV